MYLRLPFATIFLVIMGLFITNASAQKTGKVRAIYKIEILREVSEDIDAQVLAILNKTRQALQKADYELKIEGGQSLFEKEEALSVAENALFQNLADIAVRVYLTTYTNREENEQVLRQRVLGKDYLITRSLPGFDWKLLPEEKTIKGYPARKAEGSFTNDEGELLDVIAWYSTAIPYQFGPDIFQGLPGLILEVEFNERRISLHKLELNPKKDFEITKPEKGEVATREEINRKSGKALKTLGF